ncbi:MAG TPA: heavy metal sensor histidine kinase [Blastocatellia bacterium]|jgi:heavy metal sensor kinase
MGSNLMLDSVRTKLTLRYVGVLALVLVAFSVVVYMLLARNLSLRFDDGLRLTIDSMTSMLARERIEGEGEQEAAESTTEELYFPSQSFAVLDPKGKVLSERSDAEQIPPPVENFAVSDQIAFYTLSERRGYTGSHRVAVRQVRVPPDDTPYILIASQSRQTLTEELASFRSIFYIAVPATLLLTGLGGWLLARKSLAPVVAMSERARRIGAENLDQRLPVVNPRDELGRLAETFNELLARLADSFTQQRQFMADASHELRTPLYVMRTAAEVTLEQPRRDESEYREALSMVKEQTRRLTRIVEDMFTLARADAERRDMEQKDFYLDELVSETARAASLLAAHKGVRVETHLLKEVAYRGDENLLRQMILNLFDNAIKYTPPGGAVSVTLTRSDSVYEITVADTGIGIPAEAQSHIFERFYRVEKSRSRAEGENGGGAGLGLSIARWIAESHGGRLELRRSNQQGSAFVATLPADGE